MSGSGCLRLHNKLSQINLWKTEEILMKVTFNCNFLAPTAAATLPASTWPTHTTVSEVFSHFCNFVFSLYLES